MPKRLNCQGFSLAEMSVVIVIVGLLAASVLVGDSVIEQAELRKIASELQSNANALSEFQQQYGMYPGDLNVATSYWPTCVDDIGNLCNGNGDGRIGTTASSESFRAWQHLNLSEILLGAYSGENTYTIGATVPESERPGGGYHIVYQTTPIYNRVGHVLLMSADSTSSPGNPGGEILSAQHAANIDEKMDDGLANTGVLVAMEGTPDNATCLTGAPAYDLSNDSDACILYYFVK